MDQTDFQSQYPELIKDWDYSKNKISPDSYSAHSGAKVWWKCHFCGYEWQSTIHNRTTNHRNCPNCTMKGTSFGEQAVFYYVKKIFPDSINRYHDFDIELDIFIPSKRVGIEFDGIYWHNTQDSEQREHNKYLICKKNNIKLIRIKDSKSPNQSFNYDSCFAIDNLKDINQLETIIRVLLKEIDPASNKLTKTNPLQDWSTIDSIINIENDRFKILENKYLRETQDSFVYKYPDIFSDWNTDKNESFNPYSFTSSSTMKVWWKCHVCGHEWQAKIVDRTSGHNKCPICTNRILKEGVNDFATLYPNLLQEWDYKKNAVLPNKIFKRNATKIWWICKTCGYSWETTIGERTRLDKPSNCPKCKITKLSLDHHQKALNRGSLEETHPELIAEWDYNKNTISPTEVTHGSNMRVWRKCQYCGYSWETTINNWTRKKSKCPKCKCNNKGTQN